MKIDIEDLLNSIMETLDRVSFIKSDEIPELDLYMDQVTRLMDAHLKNTMREEGEGSVLTKTMINNYAKNDLLPPPEKKKYSREHVLVLIFIYYFKNVLSIHDIQQLLNPLTERYFGNAPEFSMKDIYDEVTKMGEGQIDDLKKGIEARYCSAGKTFQEVSGEEQEFLQMFSFICSLAFDIYIRKLMIEKIIDQYAERHPAASKTEKKKAAKKDAADQKAAARKDAADQKAAAKKDAAEQKAAEKRAAKQQAGLKAAEKKVAKEQAEKDRAIREKLKKEKEERELKNL